MRTCLCECLGTKMSSAQWNYGNDCNNNNNNKMKIPNCGMWWIMMAIKCLNNDCHSLSGSVFKMWWFQFYSDLHAMLIRNDHIVCTMRTFLLILSFFQIVFALRTRYSSKSSSSICSQITEWHSIAVTSTAFHKCITICNEMLSYIFFHPEEYCQFNVFHSSRSSAVGL